MKPLTKDEAISLLKQALYEIKDAPLHQDEMVLKAEETLRRVEYIASPSEASQEAKPTTWRERLKMKAEDFKSAKPIGMSEVGCIQAARITNAHLTGLAEVLERVEKCLELIKEKDSAREALAALREFKNGEKKK